MTAGLYAMPATLEAARANCAEARRRLLAAPDGSQRQRDAMADLKLFESMAATLEMRAVIAIGRSQT